MHALSKRVTLLLLFLTALLLVACGSDSPPATPTPIATTLATATATEVEDVTTATATFAPTVAVATEAPTETPTTVPLPPQDSLADSVTEMFISKFGDCGAGVKAFPFDPAHYADEGALWAVVTLGPDGCEHRIAVYQVEGDGWYAPWQSLALSNGTGAVSADNISVVEIEPSHLWIKIDSFVGTRGVHNDLVSFRDGTTRNEVSERSLTVSVIQDLNGDGAFEFLVQGDWDRGFGIYDVTEDIYRYDGEGMVRVVVEELPLGYQDLPASVIEANNQAVALAMAFRWTEARVIIAQNDLGQHVNDVGWNAQFILLNGRFVDGSVPFYQYIYAGDFEAAYEVLKQFPPDQAFTAPITFLVSTDALPAIDAIGLLQKTSVARLAEPGRASIYAVHAWALFAVDPKDPSVLTELQTARTYATKDTYLIEAEALFIGFQTLACIDAFGLTSIDADTPSNILFTNQSAAIRLVYWLDYAGEWQLYATLQPAETFLVDTFLTHPWAIAGETEKCIQVYLPKSCIVTINLN